ncbi:MAG TPA: response regulator [Verrucomicrobiae bacterium]
MSFERILVVEDDTVTRKLLQSQLLADGYEVIAVASGVAGINEAKVKPPELMILDLSLVDEDPFKTTLDGFGVMEWLHRTLPRVDFPVIIHTAGGAPGFEQRARAGGAWGVFNKSGHLRELLEGVRQALDEREAQGTLAK